MSSNTFFSILIPNLGYSPYIFQCLDSIFSQTDNGQFNYEVILCDQSDFNLFIQLEREINIKYSGRVQVYHSKIKSSYKARISLYQKALGDYILFIDSDDKLLDNALLTLYNLIKSTDCMDLYHYNYAVSDKYRNTNDYVIYSRDEYLEYFFTNRGTYPLWRKCFKRKDIRFYDEDIFMCDDGLLSLAIIQGLEKFLICNLTLYYYRINHISGSKKYSIKHLDDLCVFLIHSLPYRLTPRAKSELIYNFLHSYIIYYKNIKIFDISQYRAIESLVNIIESSTYKSNCLFFKKTYLFARKRKNIMFSTYYFLFKIFSAIYKVLGIKIKIY